jgi:hypothetical protein
MYEMDISSQFGERHVPWVIASKVVSRILLIMRSIVL